MNKWVVYSTLCSFVAGMVVWFFTFSKSTDVQTKAFMASFIQTKYAEMHEVNYRLRQFYAEQGYLPDNIEEIGPLRDSIEILYDRVDGFKRVIPYLKDTLTIHFKPKWDENEYFQSYECELDGHFEYKPRLPVCAWKGDSIPYDFAPSKKQIPKDQL